jgi:carboxylesterase type B
LQFGSNSADTPISLLDETDVKCIVVAPNYRLGLFGFLASMEICEGGSANFGFWDQRMALEWTYDCIEFFGGNKDNITVGGLSAGSYATFHQLAHDIDLNSKRQIIRRVIQWSNGCGVQPKQICEAQRQFDDLVFVLGIPRSLSGNQKLEILRSKTADELVVAWEKLSQVWVRPVLGDFMSDNLFQSLYNGSFGRRMKELGIQTLIGDLTQEWHVYKMTYPPDSYDGLVDRLSWDYPRHIAEAVCEPYNSSGQRDWREIFGKLYADMQIHSTMRGFLQCISPGVPLNHIHRYRIDWRAQCIDKRLPPEVGATHATDLAIWFFGNGDSLKGTEKELVKEWLHPVGEFLRGEKVNWGTKSLREVRYLTSDGRIEIRGDEVWDEKMPLWETTKSVTSPPTSAKARL